MNRRISNINSTVSYFSNPKTGPQLKVKRPLVLRNTVTQKKVEDTTVACQDELTSLLDCLQMHDHLNAKCAKQLRSLLTCENKYKADLERREKEAKATGKTLDGRIDPRILNTMLKKHPSITNKTGLQRQRNIYNTNAKTRRKPFPYEDDGQL
jgi:hypothetical protein